MSGTVMDTNEELPFMEEPKACDSRRLRMAASRMEHDIFFLYVFLASQDLSEDACAFLESHEEDPIPFRRYL